MSKSHETWVKEYNQTRTDVGFYAPKDRALIQLAGKDRQKFLHGMITNDIKGLPPQKAVVANLVGLKGKLLAELVVYNTGETLFIETATSTQETVIATLSKYKVIEDVKLTNVTAEFQKWVVMGPKASSFQQAICQSEFDLPVKPTYAAWVPKDQTNPEVLFISDQAWNALRIEGGIPVFGVDIGVENLPLESPYLEKGISFTKGCYIGQETIVRVAHRGGNVAHRLMGIASEKELHVGNPLQWNDKDVGHITSTTYSPQLQKYVGLALIHRDGFEPGNQLKLPDQSVGITIALPLI